MNNLQIIIRYYIYSCWLCKRNQTWSKITSIYNNNIIFNECPIPLPTVFFSFLFTLFSWIKVSHVFDQAKPYCNSPLASLKKKIYWIWIVFIDSQDVLFSNLWTSLGVRCKDGLTKAYEKDSSTKDNNVYKRDDKESHVFVM